MKRELAALLISCLVHVWVLAFLPTGGGGAHERAGAGLRLVAAIRPLSGSDAGQMVEPQGPDSGPEVSAAGYAGDYGPPAVLPVPDETYYPPERLSKQPQPLTEPDLSGRDIADAAFVGPVRLRLWISREGKVVNLASEDGGISGNLLAALRRAFMPVVFSPAEVEGAAVATSQRIEVDFGEFPGEARK